MTQSILLNGIKRKNIKPIDYILAAPAGLAIMSFIGGYKHKNPIYSFGMTEFSIVAGVCVLEVTAENISKFRNAILTSFGADEEVEEE